MRLALQEARAVTITHPEIKPTAFCPKAAPSSNFTKIRNILSNHADRQTNRQTDRQANQQTKAKTKPPRWRYSFSAKIALLFCWLL